MHLQGRVTAPPAPENMAHFQGRVLPSPAPKDPIFRGGRSAAPGKPFLEAADNATRLWKAQ